MNAITKTFPDVIRVICWRHFTENIKRKLIEMNVSEKQRKSILSLLLGQGDFKGLLDCDDEDFDDEWEETKQQS